MAEINKELKNLVENNALALATIDEKGNPHCIAVGYVKTISKNQLLVTDNYMVKTVKNIKKNPNISLTVWNTAWKKDCQGSELKGKAEYFTEGEYYDLVKKIPENKGEPLKGVILITVNKIKKLA